MELNELSLFSGAGGGLLATKLLGWKTIGYVEWNEYCQQVIAQRIKDGILDAAPIFTDVREFVQSGAARQYRGFVNVVSAGFPCQPFTVSGKQLGEEDERNRWPETLAVIREVRPPIAFLENNPGLLIHEYFGRILGDLAESGYNLRRRCLSGAELGAPHLRDRVWFVAYLSGSRAETGIPRETRRGERLTEVTNHSGHGNGGQNPRGRVEWWADECGLDRLVHGSTNRVDRLKAAGNMQIPAVAAEAWRLLTR